MKDLVVVLIPWVLVDLMWTSEGEALPVLYGDARLASLIGGSGDEVQYQWWRWWCRCFGLSEWYGDITIGSTEC